MSTLFRAALPCALTTLLSAGFLETAGAAEVATTLRLEVDAREIARKLVHARVEVPCKPGTLRLWYPKWIPGSHGASGPLENIGGFRVETPDGKALEWRRDEVETFCVACEVPKGVERVVAKLDYICNQPSVEASGHLTYGNESLAIVNWNTCLVYPEGPAATSTRVEATLRLPRDWKFATALKAKSENDGAVEFESTDLETLIDSPLIAGEHLKTFKLDTGPYPAAYFHVVSESPSALAIDPKVIAEYGKMVREACALFGSAHYSAFHFLVTCSDELGYLGLEHHASSINGVRTRDLADNGGRHGWVANLIPHEYVHSWCGKFRRPAAMITHDFHSPQKTRLLWVYEGLTEYLGELVMVRSGLVDLNEYRDTLASRLSDLSHRAGRRWRSLEDTAVASSILRGPSEHWNDLRRVQDYYMEGMLVWLEVDAMIREQTKGERSLDDFCKSFMGRAGSSKKVAGYDFDDVVKSLNAVSKYDWAGFLTSRVSRPMDELPLEFVGLCGYRLQYGNKPPASFAGRRSGSVLSARDSLGMSLSPDGRIVDVIPGMVADKAKLAPGMRVAAVNGKRFTPAYFYDALADSVMRRKIELMMVTGDVYKTVVLDYADGPRYLELVRDEKRPDILQKILRPTAGR